MRAAHLSDASHAATAISQSMEHLDEGISAHIGKVGYFVKDQYDFQGFHSFPARLGWQLNPDGQWCHNENASSSQVTQVGKLSGFLQAWLFFGLLAEVLGFNDSSELKEFSGRGDLNKPFITTGPLKSHVEKWVQDITRSGSAHKTKLIKAQLALDKAYELVSKNCSVKTYHERPSWGVNHMVALSLLVLGETLDHAVAAASQIMRFSMNGWHVKPERKWGYSQAVFAKMIHDKWCKNSLSILQGILQNSTIGMIYAMRLSHPKSLGLNHNACDPFDCKARDQEFRSRGNHEDGAVCRCRSLGPDLGDLNQHLLQDRCVLLHYDLETSSIRVVQYKKDMRYAIFSHVWADGFGNEASNTLPRCWLDMFSKLLRLASESDRMPHNEQEFCLEELQYFWIDTLTVPVGARYRDARRIALQEMRRMYASAACTIVLDAGLMSERAGSAAETAMRITMSHWVTRLWTLQEAYLSKKIFFCFADEQLVDMDHLESKRIYNPVSPLTTSVHAYHEAILGPERRELLMRRATSHERVTRRLDLKFMVALWNAMQWRTVTRPEDETLAMAILLDLDTTSFDDCDLEEGSEIDREAKMARLLSMVNEESKSCIPGNLLFLPGQKLSQRGFGWAPFTWLRQKGMSPQIITCQHGGGHIVGEGLSLQGPGFRIHCEDGGAIPNAESSLFPVNNSLTSWFSIQDVDDEVEPMIGKSLDVAILIPLVSHAQKEAIGLLVEITQSQPDILYGHILKRVQIRAEENIDLIDQARQKLLEHPSVATYGELLHPEQKWCLDGPEPDPPQTSNEDFQPHYLLRVLSMGWSGSFQWTRTRSHA